MKDQRSLRDKALSGSGMNANGRGTILVPLDGSPVAAAVLPIARAGALLLEVPIHLLHVVDVHVSMDELLQTLGLGATDVAGLVLEQAAGQPAAAILREIEAHGTRLIVMSAQGWTSDPTLPLGHVAQEVLRDASCSLLLVRSEVAQRFAEERHALARILIPLDGTPTAAAALAPAAEIAARSGASLDVLHVATSGQAAAEPGSMTVPRYQDNPHHEWRAWRHEFATRFLGRFDGQSSSVNVAAGDPASEILRMARERQSDLIVLVWKGDLAPDRAQTVRTILREAPCPLLFMRTRPSLGLPPGTIEVRAAPLTPV
jgi:nucleotide-binding universal stress UspA family protein